MNQNQLTASVLDIENWDADQLSLNCRVVLQLNEDSDSEEYYYDLDETDSVIVRRSHESRKVLATYKIKTVEGTKVELNKIE